MAAKLGRGQLSADDEAQGRQCRTGGDITVALDRDARHDHVASHGEHEENAGPNVIVLGLLDLEGLLEGDLLVSIAAVGRRRWRLGIAILLLLRGRRTVSLGRILLLLTIVLRRISLGRGIPLRRIPLLLLHDDDVDGAVDQPTDRCG